MSYPDFRREFRARVPDVHWRLISPERANRQAGQVIDRITGFLSLVALTAVFLGGAGLFMIFRARYLLTLPQILTLRCLGLSTRSLAFAAGVQGIGIVLLGWLLGFGGGAAVESFVSNVAQAQLGVALSGADYAPAALRSFVVALLMVGLAVLVPLRQVLRIPVNAAFRDADSQTLNVSRGDAAAFAGTVILLTALVSREPRLAFFFLLGFAGVLMVLSFLALSLARLGGGGWVKKPLALRHALLGFARQGASTQVLVVTLGLAAFLPATVFLLSRNLEAQMDLSHRIGVPNLFLLNVPPEDRPAIEETVKGIDFVPVTQARLVSVKGVSIEEFKISQPFQFWGGSRQESEESSEAGGEREEGDLERVRFTREYFVSRRTELALGERLVAGESFLSPEPVEGAVRVSIEEGFAARLDVKPGDFIEVEIAGVRLKAFVSSLRKADWFNFRPNFFFVFHPDDIEGAPFEYVGVAQVPAAETRLRQRELTERFPHITSLDGDSLSKRLRNLLGQLAVAVYSVGSFAVGSAFLVFIGIVLARRSSKMREISLWRCLGLDSRRALSLLGLEVGVSGAAAGLLAAGASFAFTAILCRFVFDIPFAGSGAWPVAFALVVGLPVGLGLFGAWLLAPVLRVPAAQLFQTAEENVG
jgi:putative ABC transport system permease protein